MLRQSEIANFLDLIKHITQARDFKHSFHEGKLRNSKNRYRQQQPDSYVENSGKKVMRKSLNQKQLCKNNSQQSQFGHKMLKISHDIKRKPKSIKYQNISEEKTHNLTEAEFGEKINKIRSNLYENYCEMIQKKRQQKLNRLFRSSHPDNSSPVYNISQTIHFQNENSNNIKFKEMTPIIKSKTLKPGLDSMKPKIICQKSAQNQNMKSKSKKKIQPEQLNIESMKGVKMPKIIQYHYNASQKRVSKMKKNFKIQFKSRSNPINKGNNLDGGWINEEQQQNYFNMDAF